MDVIVIGGGASGLVAAIKMREAGANVTIIEKNNKLGKKLLVTGNGHCNFWNKNQDINKYHSNDMDIFKEIYEAKNKEVLDFFDKLGIVYKEINGYYYPYSMQASSILRVLEVKIQKLGINVVLGETVKKISKSTIFQIVTDSNTYICDKVVMAVGSKAGIREGGSYSLVEDLGHTLIQVSPSLVQLVGKDNYYKDWAGVRSEAKLKLIQGAEVIKEEAGEVQFTDYGISGICVFNLSGIVARSLALEKELVVEINLVSWFKGSKSEFEKWLDNRALEFKNYGIEEMLEGFLNYKLIKVILKLLKIKEDAKYQDIDKKGLVDMLWSFKFRVKNTKDFSNAQVCSGGVRLTEVNPKTLESLKVKGLYLCGEVLDVDGDCGGYNLGFAWISGMIVGEHIND